MATIFKRNIASHKQDYPLSAINVPINKLKEHLIQACKFQVQPLGNDVFRVLNPKNGQQFIVSLSSISTQECDYTNYIEYCSLCVHACAAALYIERDPVTLFHYSYNVNSYQKTYKRFL